MYIHLNDMSKISLSASSFSSAWDASGQIPQRAVDNGLISRFGTIDDLEGGQTGRQNLNLIYTATKDDNSRFLIQRYFRRLSLTQNHGYFMNRNQYQKYILHLGIR